MLKLKLQYFGYLMQRTDSLEKTLMLGKIEGRWRRGWQRIRWLHGITSSMDMSLSNLWSWWWTEKPGVLQSMESDIMSDCVRYHPTILPSAVPFSCLRSFPASGSFLTSQFFVSGGQSVGASASVLPMSIQGLFPLGLTGWIPLQSKGLSRVFSNTTVQKHQYFGAQLSL